MYFIRMGGVSVVGSSPEMLVRVEGSRVETHPIAGTRRRGRDEEEDLRLGEELKRNEKERAEHVMLVDLGRNDVGRVCEYGSVRVPQFMGLERFSHVMHLTSIVEGKLAADCDRLDALVSCFPAGTVSGAPKVRAMQIIRELEPSGRGLYAGAVGYLDFAGNLDFCIAIRTVIMSGRMAYVQAGAGIVMDSNPAAEYEETRDKARALVRALELAQAGPLRLHDRRHRQLRFVHLQPRAVPGRARRRRARDAQRCRDGRRCAGGEAGSDRHLAGARTARRGRRHDGGDRAARARRRRSWACASATRRSARCSAASVVRAAVPMHGKTSTIEHDGRGVFTGIDGPFRRVALSLAGRGGRQLPADLIVSAADARGRHDHGAAPSTWPVHGVQFHPESILTGEGKQHSPELSSDGS